MAYESRVFRLASLSESRVRVAPIYCHDIEGGDVEIHYFSVLDMIRTYFDAFKNGIIYYDKTDECWDIDEEAFDQLRLDMNPDTFHYDHNPKAAYDSCDPKEWPKEWKNYYVGDQ